MAVLITDSIRSGCHRIIVWALLFAIGCIHYALAPKPEHVLIVAVPTRKIGAGGTLYSEDADKRVKLICTGDYNPTEWTFKQDGNDVQKGSKDELIITKFNVSSAGTYLCNAKNGDGDADSPSNSITLTLACTSPGNDGCGNFGKCTDDSTSNTNYCQCKNNAAAVFASACDECASGDTSDCGNHATCDANKKCKCTYGGDAPKCHECNGPTDCTNNANGKLCDANKCVECKTKNDCKGDKKQCHSGKCVACLANNTGCDATSATPRCEIAASKDPVCKGCNNAQFCETINKDKPVCDEKEGSCKAKAKTSDAATVTSTACLVIASIVVALLN